MNVRHFAFILLLGIVVAFAACADSADAPAEHTPVMEDRGTVELTWWGQSMFMLTAADGKRILLDPYGDIGYRIPTVEELSAHLVTVSHDHPDHSNIALGGNNAQVLSGVAQAVFDNFDEDPGNDTRVSSADSFHDAVQGQERGRNKLFVIETAGMRIAHLGDLGQSALTEEQLAFLGQIDVLLIPVGGVFTINAAGATAIVAQIGPRIVIPMHYGTEAVTFLEPIDAFLEGKDSREIASSTVGFDIDALPELGVAEIWVLEPAGG